MPPRPIGRTIRYRAWMTVSGLSSCPGNGEARLGSLPNTVKARRSILDELLQASQRFVPALRDPLQVARGVGEAAGVELPDALAPAPEVAHETRAGEDAQVLRDRLARDGGAGSQTGDRLRPAAGEARHQ